MAGLVIRRAMAADASDLHDLMQALAAYEGLTPYLAATPDGLTEALAVQPPRAVILSDKDKNRCGLANADFLFEFNQAEQ